MSTRRGFLDPRAGRCAHVQRDLRAFDRRKEILAEERARARTSSADADEADDEQAPPGQGGDEKAR